MTTNQPPQPPTSNPTKPITQCAICQYELTNQPTTYIPDYHLITVRCPECGQQQPAGITTQPWKFRKLKYTCMLTLWTLLLLFPFIAIPIALSSMAQSTTYAALAPFEQTIITAQAQSDPKYHTARWDATLNPRYEINVDWWDDLGRQYAKDSFIPSQHIDWIVLTDWFWFLLIAPPIALLAHALLRRSHWLTQTLFLSTAFLIAALATYTTTVNYAYWYQLTPRNCSIETAAKFIAWPTYAIGTITILIAYLFTPHLLTQLKKLFPNIPHQPPK